MEVKIVSEKNISGLIERTNNANEMTPGKGKIPALWQRFDDSVAVDYKLGEHVYGVYYDYESDHSGDFTVLAGFDGEPSSDNSDIKKVTIPSGKYLVFTRKGEMPQIAIDAWTEVWNYFSAEQPANRRLYTVDFEFYPGANEIQVHIAIE